MRKLNATLLNEGNKEEAILKIKDDSFAINTNDQLIKIPYFNIKGYNFDKENQVLSIIRFGGNPIELNIVKDKQLLELLNSITSQNKSDSNESIPNYESNSPKENERKLERNATIRDTKPTNNDGIIGVIVVVIIIGIIVFGIKSIFFNEPKCLKGDVLGSYSLHGTSLKVMFKENTMVEDTNENKTYEIKDIKSKSDGNYIFNLYDDGSKVGDCVTTFGMISCTWKNGAGIIFTKN